MKKSITFLFLLLLAVTAGAKTISKIANPTYVGINDGTMKIVSVKTTEEATTVTFQYPGEGFGFFSQKTYLMDELGESYSMIGQKGFSEDSLKRLVPKKKGKYELRFKPLPEGTRIFDLIEKFYDIDGSKFYGIREAGAPFSVTSPKSHNEGGNSLPDIDFKVDSVLITGHIDYGNSEREKFKRAYQFTTHAAALAFLGENRFHPKVRIDEQGNFELKLNIIGPTWAYLTLTTGKGERDAMFIPCMLYPGDHLDIHIVAGNDSEEEQVTYKSSLDKDFSRLMGCAPMVARLYEVVQIKGKDYTEEYQKMTPELIKGQFEALDALGLYLSGKYGLNGVETEMLRSHLSVTEAINILGLTHRYIEDLHFKGNVSPADKVAWRNTLNDWMNSDSPNFALAFSNIRAGSNAFLTTPYWSALFIPYHLINFSRHQKQVVDFDIYKWETILGRELESDGHRASYGSYTSKDVKNVIKFEEQQNRLYYDWMMKLIREWRQKGGDDSLFEQAYMLFAIKDDLTFHLDIKHTHRQFVLRRELFSHPSIVRIADTLLYIDEQEHYKNLE